jgi:DNA-binding response OmpR family regulator
MPKLKIVLIEDDEILAKVVYEELIEADFDVFKAFNGEEGLELARSKKPDLVLLDLILPKKHGFDVLEELKKSPVTHSIPVIILTMLGRDDDIKKGLKLGANDYIVKSQHAVSEIVERVEKFFGKETHPEAKKSQKKQPESSQNE